MSEQFYKRVEIMKELIGNAEDKIILDIGINFRTFR